MVENGKQLKIILALKNTTVPIHTIKVTYKVAVDVRQKGTTKVKTKVITMNIKEAPAYSMYFKLLPFF